MTQTLEARLILTQPTNSDVWSIIDLVPDTRSVLRHLQKAYGLDHHDAVNAADGETVALDKDTWLKVVLVDVDA